MRVKDLIEDLQQYPDTLIISIEDSFGIPVGPIVKIHREYDELIISLDEPEEEDTSYGLV